MGSSLPADRLPFLVRLRLLGPAPGVEVVDGISSWYLQAGYTTRL